MQEPALPATHALLASMLHPPVTSPPMLSVFSAPQEPFLQVWVPPPAQHAMQAPTPPMSHPYGALSAQLEHMPPFKKPVDATTVQQDPTAPLWVW